MRTGPSTSPISVRARARSCTLPKAAVQSLRVGIKLQQNNELLTAQARYNLRVQRADLTDTFIEPHVMDAMHKLGTGAETTPTERITAAMAAGKLIEMWEWQYGEYTAGMLELQQLPLATWRVIYNGEGPQPSVVRLVWEAWTGNGTASPEFAEFMRQHIVAEP